MLNENFQDIVFTSHTFMKSENEILLVGFGRDHQETKTMKPEKKSRELTRPEDAKESTSLTKHPQFQ